MMKEEFESLLGKTVTDESYAKIEYVYTNNNFFSNVNGKQEAVEFYEALGMNGIDRMYLSTKAEEKVIHGMQDLNAELRAAASVKSDAVVDALNYTIAGLNRKRSTYLTAMAAALDAGDRAEYKRADELDRALQERICAMEKELPGA